MDQIRNTMMQHEALFKEQVQALHKLYDIQILAMQEVRRRMCSSQALTFSSERVLLKDDPSNYSILEGKPLKPVYANGLVYKEEYLALSLGSFVTLGELKGSGSFLMDGIGNDDFPTAGRKPMRNLDLEKLPEDLMDEPDINVRSCNSEMADANTNSMPSQINLNCDQPSQDKAFEIDVKKCITSLLESNSTITEKNVLKEHAWEHSPPVGSFSTMEKLKLLHQGSSILMTESDAVNTKDVYLNTVLDLGKGSNCSGCPEKHQDVGFGSTITRSTKLEESNCYNIGDFLPKNPTICYQGSLFSDPLYSEPKSNIIQRSLPLQTGIDGKDDSPEDSSDRSKSVLSQDTTSCKNENESAYAENREKGQKSVDGGEAVESVCQEQPQFKLEKTTGHATDKPSVYEECESIAAEILLSFAPSRRKVDSQFHCAEARADDSSKSCQDNVSNRNLYRTMYPNCSQAGGTNKSTTWTKSVTRRRTSSRLR